MSTEKVAVSRKQIGGEVPMVVSEIIEQGLYTGLFGSIDSARMAQVTELITFKCEELKSKIVIIDLANVDAIDTAVSAHLISLGRVLELIGVQIIFCGINGSLARTMVTAEVQFGGLKIVRDLKEAVAHAYSLTGFQVTKAG
jgi:rsbT co-antagonist protein RsbR